MYLFTTLYKAATASLVKNPSYHRILPYKTSIGAKFGHSLSLSANILAVGAPGDSDGSESINAGAVYLYQLRGSTLYLRGIVRNQPSDSDSGDGDSGGSDSGDSGGSDSGDSGGGDEAEDADSVDIIPPAEAQFGTAVAIVDQHILISAEYGSSSNSDASPYTGVVTYQQHYLSLFTLDVLMDTSIDNNAEDSILLPAVGLTVMLLVIPGLLVASFVVYKKQNSDVNEHVAIPVEDIEEGGE